MTNLIARNKKSIIRAAFLIPVFSVAAISISHVVSWYDLANPLSWAVYLSIAVEVAAMSAIAASSVKVKGFSVWFVFSIVTLIQFIGNIFFSYSDINIDSKQFKDWAELTAPIFESMGSDISDFASQRRWLALLEGGLLPLISLTCLHFFIKYGDIDESVDVAHQILVDEQTNEKIESTILEEIEITPTSKIDDVANNIDEIEVKQVEEKPFIEKFTQIEPEIVEIQEESSDFENVDDLTVPPVTDETLGTLINQLNDDSAKQYRVAEISNKMKKIRNK